MRGVVAVVVVLYLYVYCWVCFGSRRPLTVDFVNWREPTHDGTMITRNNLSVHVGSPASLVLALAFSNTAPSRLLTALHKVIGTSACDARAPEPRDQ